MSSNNHDAHVKAFCHYSVIVLMSRVLVRVSK